MTITELKLEIQALRQNLSYMEQIKPSCKSCEHFIDDVSCNKFDSNPPPDWVSGKVECPQWEYCDVPF